MPVLKCSVKNCYYNKEQLCCREGINVEGSNAEQSDATLCASFEEKMDEKFSNNVDNNMNPHEKSMIDCQAEKCVYNSNRKCTAAKVNINGMNATSRMDTSCATFVK